MTAFGHAVPVDRCKVEETASSKTPMQWHRTLISKFGKHHNQFSDRDDFQFVF